jgi:hypothetical protein
MGKMLKAKNKSRGRKSKRMSYEDLKAKVQKLRAENKLPVEPTRAQKIDWAYGNAVIENPNVTREMAERAVDAARPLPPAVRTR